MLSTGVSINNYYYLQLIAYVMIVVSLFITVNYYISTYSFTK